MSPPQILAILDADNRVGAQKLRRGILASGSAHSKDMLELANAELDSLTR